MTELSSTDDINKRVSYHMSCSIPRRISKERSSAFERYFQPKVVLSDPGGDFRDVD